MKIVVDRLPKTYTECRFYCERGHRCQLKQNGYVYDKKCEIYNSTSLNKKCPFLLTLEESLNWVKVIGHLPDEAEEFVYQLQHGKLKKEISVLDTVDNTEPTRSTSVPAASHLIKKRKWKW